MANRDAQPHGPPSPSPDPPTLLRKAAAVLVVDGPIRSADAPLLCDRARAAIGDDAAAVLICDLAALPRADIGTVDALARLALAVGRLGCRMELRSAGPDLRDLLGLSGLGRVLPCSEASGVEAGR